MNEYPVVSVVISNWNRLEDLKKCIQSVVFQNYPNIELIVVDNCSEDGSIEYLRGLDLDLSSYRLFIMPHSNFSAMHTLNYGFWKSTGEYVFVLDNDAEIIGNNVLSKLVSKMLEDPQIFAISTNVIGPPNLVNQMVITDQAGMRLLTAAEVRIAPTFEWLEFHGAGTLMRRDIGNILKWYNEDFFIYANEMDLSIRAWNRGYKVLYCPETVVYHNASTAWKPEFRNRYHGYKNILYIIDRYFSFWNRVKLYFLSLAVHSQRFIFVILRTKKVPLKILLKWAWLSVIYFIRILIPLRGRQITSKRNQKLMINRLWMSFKLYFWKHVIKHESVWEYGL